MKNLQEKLEHILFDNDLNINDKIQVLQKIEEKLDSLNNLRNHIYLRNQIKDVMSSYYKIQDTYDLKRPYLPLWIINLNYNDLKKQYNLDDKSSELFDKKLKSILKTYSYSVAKSQGFGKKTLLFDNKRSFRIFISFLHSAGFVYELNKSIPNIKVSLSNRNFHIKAAKISQKDNIEEILSKMNDSFIELNDEDYDVKLAVKKINDYLFDITKYNHKVDKETIGILEKILSSSKKLKSIVSSKIKNKKVKNYRNT